MQAVGYERFTGIDGVYVSDVETPRADPGEVLVEVRAAGLNPGSLSALQGSSYTPIRDLAGDVVAVGPGVESVQVGDAVLGWSQSWDAHAQVVAVPADQLIAKPADLSWDVAGCLYTTPMAGAGAVRAVAPAPGELLAVSGASGGVGSTAGQLAVRAGARVLGLTSAANAGTLREHGIEPVVYGQGEEERLREAAGGRPIDAFIDAVGGHYIDLALTLGVAPGRINTVVDHARAAATGAMAWGTRDAGGLPALVTLATLGAAGELHVPIAATFPLIAVQDAYRALARRPHGRVVLHPQDPPLSS